MAEELSKDAANYLRENKVYEKLHDALVYVLEKECPSNYLELMRDFFKSGRMPKIIVLGCPGAGVTTHSKHLAELLGAVLIEDNDQNKILEKMSKAQKGWIIAGYPSDYAQACSLRRAGVFPNLVIRLTIEAEESVKRQMLKGIDKTQAFENIQSYMRISERTVQVYSSVLQTVDTTAPEGEVRESISSLISKIGTWIHPSTKEHYPLGMEYEEGK